MLSVRSSVIAAALLLVMPLSAGATPPPSVSYENVSVCGGAAFANLSIQFSQSGGNASVVTTAEVHRNPFYINGPRWASVYSESAYRTSPSSAWVTSTEQHDAPSGSGTYPDAAVTGKTTVVSPTCEIKGRYVLSVGCPGSRTSEYIDRTVSWPGCGT